MKRDQFSLDKTKKALIATASTVLFFSSLAHAEIGDSLVLCKHNKTVRTLRIETTSDQRCKAIYTKQGVDQNIGSGQNHNSCEEYVAGVRKTLEDAKWNCREVKEARTSMVAPVTE
ncbi:hypothetical protein [Bdellovibrio sp. NC01]|uniref:hypothetical protein n=1 Tax=Bdellovibrio sp. NC01 TaxID=2220073 RepID=UPI0011576FA8|nr:hypothetical protein [Bdellovibrio sp. NC01]QDK39644.1 hypothetical protein DOE51_04450 [Bdellovibrio sp. NC01]